MKRLMLPDKRPLDLVGGPSVLGLLDVRYVGCGTV